MQRFAQDPRAPGFVADPYPFYDRLRAAGPLVFWEELRMPVAAGHAEVAAILKDARLGRARELPSGPPHLAPFWEVERRSLLELEPPEHTALRARVLRAFTSRRVAALAPRIAALADDLVAAFPSGPFDLLDAYARPIPVRTIARLLGVPEADSPDLLRWSNAMVGMYRPAPSPTDERAAGAAARDFRDYLLGHMAAKRRTPAEDLLSDLAQGGLPDADVVSTAILLLNAGHEATVHAIGLAAARLLADGASEVTEGWAEEALRIDPPLHLFTRHAYREVAIGDHVLRPGDEVGLLLGAANRDAAVWPDPARFDPARAHRGQAAFGLGIHFCLGAPLARLELRIALERLAAAGLRLTEAPRIADIWHFRGYEAVLVERG